MLSTITHRSMATEFVVMLAAEDQHQMDAAFQALEQLDAIEAALSTYRSESEISLVNRSAYDAPVKLSSSIYALLERSLQWSQLTDGAFDITAGPLIRAWGFMERRGRVPSRQELEQTLKSCGHQKVLLNPSDQSIQFQAAGMELNLGAIGKGYALDVLSKQLLAQGVNNFLIHGGNSSVIAQGNQSSDSDPGWAVGVAHPTKPNVRLAGFRLHNQALSTSGTGKQFFHHRGKRYGHVIDPRTGQPGGELLSLTAVMDNATDAEAASTAYFLSSLQSLSACYEDQGEIASFPHQTPSLLAVRKSDRQDQVITQSLGTFNWVDPPATT
ncbi:MAG: hypothetical protein CBB71_09105 [Rhodopirellula sp. TMED11]|nr:MAG: hypothetical protein CBB71_09105 [Rhodopirellula sp. TMED11]